MAGGIPETTLDEIRARIDIVDLVHSRVPLKKVGGRFKTCCPFHREKTPSFVVDPARQSYHCFGCGEGGDIFSFLMKMDGLRFPDAVKILGDRAGVVVKLVGEEQRQRHQWLYALHAKLAAFYQHCLIKSSEAEVARIYLAGRKLAPEIIESFGLGYAPGRTVDTLLKWGKEQQFTPEQMITAGVLIATETSGKTRYRDRFRGRLIFPIHDRQGRVVAFSARLLQTHAKAAKYVNSPETPIFMKSRVLYAFDKAMTRIVKHPRREALICEGQIDVIRCHASGFETAIASQGTAFTQEHVKLLKRYADSVVLVFDGDTAGRKAAIRTGQYFLEEEIPVRVAQIPAGEDPDSLLRDKGAAAFREVLERAPSITAHQIASLLTDESRPDSLDALNRISRAVLDVLAVCPGAVLRTRLLQEAAELLHLPYSALADDLEKHCEALASRTAYAKDRKESVRLRPQATGQLLTPEARTPEASAIPRPARAEYLLCELMIEHEHDEEVLALIEAKLPLALVRHPLCRQIVSVILAQQSSGEDELARLYRETAPTWRPLFDMLLAQKQKMMSAEEMTKNDATQDLIRWLWVAHLKRKQAQLDDANDAEVGIRRIKLSILIKQLSTRPWKQVCTLLDDQMTQGVTFSVDEAVQTASVVATEPSAHAAGNASSASDPAGFPANALPPDEMPN